MTTEEGDPAPPSERHLRGIGRPGPPGPPAGVGPGRAMAAGLAASLAMGAYCLAMAVHGVYPFGSRSRAVNDLGNQFVPFHAHLWDLMHGNTTGDLVFNWGSGYGVPFLADFAAYLMNPLSWLVGPFPRDMVEFPVFLVTLLSIGLGTGLMTSLLLRIRTGPPWQAGLLAVGYGVSSWTVAAAAADPMWMWGLVSLPLTGIAMDWCLRRRRWVPAVLLVSLSWAGNFYTAAMGTLAMVLVLAVRLATDGRPAGERVRCAGRALSATAVGVVLVAPVLTVPFLASRAAQPAPPATYVPPGLRTYLAHLLPAGYAGSAPFAAVGVLALPLALCFPFMGQVPRRERALWSALAVAVASSLVWEPTILLWHGFALPNGGPYRASLALTAILVLIAWLALARGPRAPQLTAGAALTALLLVTAGTGSAVSRGTWVLTSAGCGTALGLLWFAAHRAPHLRRTVAAGLAITAALGAAGATLSLERIRDDSAWWQPKPTFGPHAAAAYASVRARSAWPLTRSDPGPHAFADNDPLLLGGQGGAYYSSFVPARSARTLAALGAGWYIGGRHLLSFDAGDPVGHVLMGVAARLDPSDADPPGFAQHLAPALPVVTLRAAGTRLDGESPHDPSVFHLRNRLMGAPLYLVRDLDPARPARPRPDTAAILSGSCPVGSDAYLHAPWYSGTVRALGATTTLRGQEPMTRNGLVRLGRVTTADPFPVELRPARAQPMPSPSLGCLDPARLERTVRGLAADGPTVLDATGHTIRASFAGPRRDVAVIAVPAVDGWRCAVDGGRPRAPSRLGGLIAVRMNGGQSLACTYRTAGVGSGLALSAAAALALLTVCAAGAAHRLRRGGR
ncbi:YfhO family protein [Streptomyces sp. NPDC006670]|uniref:YfhO family protein n=1 Tax=Streptomyces sp. NPDC006670 TaxID=3154476 RepID=UPI0033C9FEA2